MKNFKISIKLIISFGTVLALLVIMLIVALLGLNNINSNMELFYNKPFQNVQYTDKLQTLLHEGAKNLLHASLSTNPDETKTRLAQAENMFDSFYETLNLIKVNYGGDLNDLTKIEDSITKIESLFDIYESLCLANDIDGAFAVYSNDIVPYLGDTNTLITTVSERANLGAKTTYEDSLLSGKINTIVMIIIGFLSFIISLFMAFYITKQLVRSINDFKQAALKMSEGDFDISFTYNSKDEFGELENIMSNMIDNIDSIIQDANYVLGEMANGDFTVRIKDENAYKGIFVGLKEAMRKMNRRLSQTLLDINQASEQVANGSGQVATGSQSLATGATEQASSVQELAATITEISDQIKLSADNAVKANETTLKAQNKISECSDYMNQMISAMNEITEKSGKIDKIIKTIEDIAFQTNILALNAAVEAARAGEAGKGFSVVADEVRNLASKSGEASQNTANLIEDTIIAVRNGTEIANKTADALMNVIDSSKTTALLVDEIANASEKQSKSIVQISTGIEQISNVVQTNSATAQESAATSQQLSGQAQILKDLVSRFNLNNNFDTKTSNYTSSEYAETEIASTKEDYSTMPIYMENKY